MHLTRNKCPVVTTYFLNGQALERTDAHPHLGVIISSDLRLNNHCDYVVKKGLKNAQLYFLVIFIIALAKLRPNCVFLSYGCLLNMLVVLGIPILSAIF